MVPFQGCISHLQSLRTLCSLDLPPRFPVPSTPAFFPLLSPDVSPAGYCSRRRYRYYRYCCCSRAAAGLTQSRSLGCLTVRQTLERCWALSYSSVHEPAPHTLAEGLGVLDAIGLCPGPDHVIGTKVGREQTQRLDTSAAAISTVGAFDTRRTLF